MVIDDLNQLTMRYPTPQMFKLTQAKEQMNHSLYVMQAPTTPTVDNSNLTWVSQMEIYLKAILTYFVGFYGTVQFDLFALLVTFAVFYKVKCLY